MGCRNKLGNRPRPGFVYFCYDGSYLQPVYAISDYHAKWSISAVVARCSLSREAVFMPRYSYSYYSTCYSSILPRDGELLGPGVAHVTDPRSH